MDNLNIIIAYLTRNIKNAKGAYMIQDDGEGQYIPDGGWFVPTLGEQPTEQELQDAEEDALAWQSSGAGKISYNDFWFLLSLPLRIKVNNRAEELKIQTPPDTGLKTLIGFTYDKSNMIDLNDPAVVGEGGYFEEFMSDLVVSGVLTAEQAAAWAALENVA